MDEPHATGVEDHLHTPVEFEPGPEREYAGVHSVAEAWQHLRAACEPVHYPGQARPTSMAVLFGSSASFRLVGSRAFFGRIEPTPGGCRIAGRYGLTRERRFVKIWMARVFAPVAILFSFWWYGYLRNATILAVAIALLVAVVVFVRVLAARSGNPVEQALREAAGPGG